MKNPLAKIPTIGQSIWLDYIRRKFITSGELKKLIDEDELRGLTSNPAIFEEAIARSDDYADTIKKLAKAGKSAEEIFLNLAIEDVQNAADLFAGVYEKTNALDGYVSLEVSPGLALVTEGTITEARSSWETLDRKNVMIKVPGTNEGLPAIEQLISDGININVTLLFGLDRYSKVADAYISGLEKRVEKGEPVENVASVASFFLSRIDTLIDPKLQEIVDQKNDKSALAKSLLGKAAIASARLAYKIFKEKFSSDRFLALKEKGAKPQRLLWASTSTKNPLYNELMYIEALIGPEEGIAESEVIHQQLKEVGIDLDAVTKQLEEEGIQKFVKPFDSLMSVLNAKREEKLESK